MCLWGQLLQSCDNTVPIDHITITTNQMSGNNLYTYIKSSINLEGDRGKDRVGRAAVQCHFKNVHTRYCSLI